MNPVAPNRQRFPAAAPPRVRGFTLLELLVALAVFAVVAVMAYGGLNGMMETREHARDAGRRLGDLQLAVTLIAADVRQALPRGATGAYGDPQPPVDGARDGFELTRAGHANPMESKRAHVQRVRWGLESGSLVRWTWPVLDRTPGATPSERRLLDGVRAISVEYRVAGDWQGSWPGRAGDPVGLPRALRVTLELADWGTVRRVFLLPGESA